MKIVIDEYNELKFKFAQLDVLKKKVESAPQEEDEDDIKDNTKNFLNSFYSHAEKTMVFIGNKIKDIDVKYAELMKYLGDDKRNCSLDKFVDIFNNFSIDLLSSLKKYKEDKEREERQRKQKKK